MFKWLREKILAGALNCSNRGSIAIATYFMLMGIVTVSIIAGLVMLIAQISNIMAVVSTIFY